jgi:hypothetical protein
LWIDGRHRAAVDLRFCPADHAYRSWMTVVESVWRVVT